YLAEFTTRPNQWQEIELRLSDFQASFRGRRLELPAIAPASISSIGFLIADRRDGPFVLEVDWIEALATDPGVESHGR
ncbi:MAG: CIA30 family protein, partial [Pseudomonadota bacterium]